MQRLLFSVFYIISGFLISRTLDVNYDRTASGVMSFYFCRAMRIYPAYWLVLAAVVIFHKMYGFSDPYLGFKDISMDLLTRWALIIANAIIFGMDGFFWSESLRALPQGSRIIGPIWSVSHELLFYIIAPFICRYSIIKLAIIFILAIIFRFWIGDMIITGDSGSWMHTLLPGTASLFILGILGYKLRYYTIRLANTTTKRFLVIATPVGLLLATSSFHLVHDMDTPLLWVYYVTFALSLPTLITIPTRFAGNFLGELSYPIYIVHMFAIAVGALFFPDIHGVLPRLMIDTIILLAAAIGLTLLLEHPLTKMRKRLRFRINRQMATSTASQWL